MWQCILLCEQFEETWKTRCWKPSNGKYIYISPRTKETKHVYFVNCAFAVFKIALQLGDDSSFPLLLRFSEYFEEKYEWWFISIYSATFQIFLNILRSKYEWWFISIYSATFQIFLNVLRTKYEWWFISVYSATF